MSPPRPQNKTGARKANTSGTKAPKAKGRKSAKVDKAATGRMIDAADLDDIAVGGAILGTGGRGDP
jgi:hypothetical protein